MGNKHGYCSVLWSVFLECGELGAWEDAEGDYAADEGLEEGAAEEGTVAVGWVVSLLVGEFARGKRRETCLRRW